jgi:hypothetical protein
LCAHTGSHTNCDTDCDGAWGIPDMSAVTLGTNN